MDVVNLVSRPPATVVHPLTRPASLGLHFDDVDEASGLAWSPDGTTLAIAAEDPVVWLWVGSAAAPVYLLYANQYRGGSVAFSPDGRLLLDGSLIFNWAATLERNLSGPYAGVAFSPRADLMAAASENGGIVLWDYQDLTSRWLLTPPRATTLSPGRSCLCPLDLQPGREVPGRGGRNIGRGLGGQPSPAGGHPDPPPRVDLGGRHRPRVRPRRPRSGHCRPSGGGFERPR